MHTVRGVEQDKSIVSGARGRERLSGWKAIHARGHVHTRVISFFRFAKGKGFLVAEFPHAKLESGEKTTQQNTKGMGDLSVVVVKCQIPANLWQLQGNLQSKRHSETVGVRLQFHTFSAIHVGAVSSYLEGNAALRDVSGLYPPPGLAEIHCSTPVWE